MIRVLQVIGCLNRAGAETMIVNVLRNIDTQKIQFDFLVYGDAIGDYEKEVITYGAKVIHIQTPSSNYYQFYKNLQKVMRTNGPYKIVHAHILFNNGFILRAAYKTGIPNRISHSHSTQNRINEMILTRFYAYIMRKQILKYATDFFACSYRAGEFLYSKQIFDAKGIVINNSINTNDFSFDINIRNKVRKKMEITDKFIIGHVGRFQPSKNHIFLLDIFKAVHDRNKDSVLLLVGDGELRPQIEKKIADLDLIDSVILTGVRADTAELYQAMDVFVFPSLFEGLGIVAIEAQAAGLPCIVANTIPREAFITDLIKSVPLEEPPEVWSTEILKYKEGFERKDTSEQVRQAGYDTKEQAKWLEEFYLSRGVEN
ncbi:glycosyltransferase family 1 protein [Caproiciproducens sp. CPB-2]|uniref:glycosyltransferase family 1 protein n=1 Tax=Caproiciproducens sp. CPB-2 TaxID=3030017 RepID=UPI0023DC5C36|nr:glycosyltransferase family 1 protein [Caproiciproducens sp. CPB-2]MDF1494090.1 glycosyltransferase family 1 protein [Caproiciproducens sp. CPB-2]